MSVAAVVLAAGASTRLGSPKQLAILAGETLLQRAVRVARQAGCSPVVVVLGAASELVQARSSLGDAVTVVNEHWPEGMASSIRLGVRTVRSVAPESEGVLLMTCDQPAVTAQHLQLVASGSEKKASQYAGRKGVPAYLPSRYFDSLMALHGDAGARELLADAPGEQLAAGELDIDTVEDLEQARTRFG